MESIRLIVDDFAPIDDVMEVGADEIVESYGHFVDEMIATKSSSHRRTTRSAKLLSSSAGNTILTT